jgi:hypothetical protein
MTGITLIAVGLFAVPADAQLVGPQVRERGPLVPLDIEVVISRYQGEKRISSVPYQLAVNAEGGESKLRMGSEVPVYAAIQTAPAAKDQPGLVRSYNYRSIGTTITSSARSAPDNRFEISLYVEDSSVYTGSDKAVPGSEGIPVFRNFNSTNTLLLRDGQTRQYTAAVDRVSGEVVKVEVTLRIVK